MASDFDNLNLSPEQMASQLRHPEGEAGVEMGLQMNKGNKHICMNTYMELSPSPGSRVLEIGMGNGFFVKELINTAGDLHYTGIDYSQTMVEAAQELNSDLIDKGNVRFVHVSIADLPFENATFDYVTTTNTIYFWPNPEQNIKELARVMKSGGKIVIAYRSRTFLDQIELTQFGFTKFDKQDVEHLLTIAGFKQINTSVILEPETVKLGEKELEVEGLFTKGLK